MANQDDLGQLVVGEKPRALDYQYLDSDGQPLDLTGYTAKFVFREQDGSPTMVNATVTDPLNGVVTYVWAGTEMPTPGSYIGEFWVGNGAQRYASWLIKWTARLPVGTVPSL